MVVKASDNIQINGSLTNLTGAERRWDELTGIDRHLQPLNYHGVDIYTKWTIIVNRSPTNI